MSSKFKEGDRVTWNGRVGTVTGVAIGSVNILWDGHTKSMLYSLAYLDGAGTHDVEHMTDNVVSIFSQRKGKTAGKKEGLSFDDVMKRNAANKKREEEERRKNNKNVKRSYRLTPDKD